MLAPEPYSYVHLCLTAHSAFKLDSQKQPGAAARTQCHASPCTFPCLASLQSLLPLAQRPAKIKLETVVHYYSSRVPTTIATLYYNQPYRPASVSHACNQPYRLASVGHAATFPPSKTLSVTL